MTAGLATTEEATGAEGSTGASTRGVEVLVPTAEGTTVVMLDSLMELESESKKR